MYLLNSTFTNFGGYPPRQASIQVLVNEPTTLTALYRTEPNLAVIALVAGLPLLAVIIFLLGTRGAFGEFRAWIGQSRRKKSQQRPTFLPAQLPSPDPLTRRNGTHVPLQIGEEHR